MKQLFSAPTLLQGRHYTPSSKTDITKTWRAAGWTPKHKPTPQRRLDYERISNTVV